MKGPLQVLFLALVLAALTQVIWQYDGLPGKVATHFNATGQANGWMTRGQHTAWHVVTLLFLAGLFQGIAWLQPRLPREYVNLPHREYWLAPERAAATHAWVVGAVRLLGCAIMLFFIALFQLIYQANLSTPPRLSLAVWWLTGGLLAVLAGVLIVLLARFGRKPAV